MTKRIFICSPYRARAPYTVEDHVRLLHRLTAATLGAGHAPFAPHDIYTNHLDDSDEVQRELGIAAGKVWLAVCDEVWAFVTEALPPTTGMAHEIAYARSIARPIIYSPPAWRGIKLPEKP